MLTKDRDVEDCPLFNDLFVGAQRKPEDLSFENRDSEVIKAAEEAGKQAAE